MTATDAWTGAGGGSGIGGPPAPGADRFAAALTGFAAWFAALFAAEICGMALDRRPRP